MQYAKRVVRVLLFASLLPASGAIAAEENDITRRFSILGAGTLTCEEWVSAGPGSTVHLAARSWVLGMVSGYNVMGPDGRGFFFNYDEDNLVASVHGQCERNPEASVADATEELLTAITGVGFENSLPPQEQRTSTWVPGLAEMLARDDKELKTHSSTRSG
jgi:hypothetical protein